MVQSYTYSPYSVVLPVTLSSVFKQRQTFFSSDDCMQFPSPVEVNCSFVFVCFVFNTALYNEKVGVNERKRKRRTTIRLYIFMGLHVRNAFS